MLLKKPLHDFVRMSSDVFVGEKKIKCAYSANGAPTVVFENGFCSGLSCMKYWDSAFLELSKEYSLFAYDRSDDEIKSQEIEDISSHLEDTIELLRTLLGKKELKAPYVLVGHSLGGLYMQYFAKKYPDEVAGLVLVDAVYPNGFAQDNVLDNNIAKIGKVILEMPSFGQKPMVILSATQKAYRNDKCHQVQKIDDSIKDQKMYTKLYPHAQQTWVESGHLIQYEKPDVIVGAIREMINVTIEK